MINPVSLPVPAWLENDLITLAWCWRIERRDGAILGFTTHDADIMRGTLVYRAAPGMDPSAIRLSSDLGGDSMDVAGALTHAALSATELAAGRYDGAIVTISVLDWTNDSEPAIIIAHGRIAGVEQSQGQFKAEISLRLPAFDSGVCVATSPTCRARLGDASCRVDMAGRRRMVQVTGAAGHNLTVAEPLTPDVYRNGELRWIDGAMAGQYCGIMGQSGAVLMLTERPAIAPQSGWRVEIAQGCDKRIDTCHSKFANAVQFQGEPYLPGMDLLTRYPGG